MTTRWCPSGQHWSERVYFRALARGGIARDCLDCERAARERRSVTRAQTIAKAPRMDGVDIDRTHRIMKANPQAARRRA